VLVVLVEVLAGIILVNYMINIDGSHEAWLIYSDWLEDQDDSLCHQIRSELEDEIDNWDLECLHHRGRYVGSDMWNADVVGDSVGGFSYFNGVGGTYGMDVGDNND
jgi:hypothetical protein